MPTAEKRCAVCQSTKHVAGTLANHAWFVPNETRSGFMLSKLVTVFGLACTECGHLTLSVDTAKLKSLLPR